MSLRCQLAGHEWWPIVTQRDRLCGTACQRCGQTAPAADLARVPDDTTAPVELRLEVTREVDGRWIADVPALPGVMIYGETIEEAVEAAKALALHVCRERYGERAVRCEVVAVRS